jgi:hypothetical protein
MTLFFGEGIDPASGERDGARVDYDAAHLTTHGVIVGMTGSGKTGMGLVLLEEVLRSGVPALILDPKGDMGNLLLTFEELSEAEFAPWVEDPAQAGATAARWRDGLSSWGLGAGDVKALRAKAELAIYTPGSTAGTPLNVLGSLEAPGCDWEGPEAERVREEVEGFVAGLLGLVGIAGDPLTSREHILLANVVEHAWRAGRDLDLAALIGQVQAPPFRKLGVFDLDAFFPPGDRLALAMKLNALVANPAFTPWLAGDPLDVQSLLWTSEGKPRAAVIALSHLSPEERQFVVTLLLSKVATWMQTQPGTSDLRALVYMDEVFGFCPPTAAPPSKKPILTLLKQARAFGVGLVLATQNPVDLDYKAMSNTGTWLIGRLQTERDKLRIVEALRSATGEALSGVDGLLSGLGKRQFLLHSTHAPPPKVFTTRWALSFLRGPLTRAEIGRFTAGAPEPAGACAPNPAQTSEATPAPEDSGPPLADDESPLPPKVADGVKVHHLDPGAPWAREVGAVAGGKRLEAGLCARVQLRFDERAADLDHREEWEAVFFPLGDQLDPEAAQAVDYDDRDLRGDAPEGARYVLPAGKLHTKGWFKEAQRDLKAWLLRSRTVEVYRNKPLKLYGRIGESEEAFAKRCDAAAQDRADAESAKLQARYAKKVKAAERGLRAAERAVTKAETSLEATEQDNKISGIGSVLNIFLGGRATTRGTLSRAVRAGRGASSRRSKAQRAQARLDEAQDKVEEKQERIEELEDELVAELEEIDARWAAVAAEVESLEVGLERTDVEVDELALVWIPTD